MRTKNVTIFGPKVVTISVCNKKHVNLEILQGNTLHFYNIPSSNVAILLISVCSFSEYTFLRQNKEIINVTCILSIFLILRLFYRQGNFSIVIESALRRSHGTSDEERFPAIEKDEWH